jgi:hypothetical protein
VKRRDKAFERALKAKPTPDKKAPRSTKPKEKAPQKGRVHKAKSRA